MENQNLWNKVMQHPDVIIYELKTSGINARIECRKEEAMWHIFKTYYYKDINYTEEFSAYNEEELDMLLKQLMKEPLLTLEEIKEKKMNLLRYPKVLVKRAYKEDNIEKWLFSIDDDGYFNFFIIRDYDEFEIDIVMNEKYAPYESKIIETINNILSLNNIDADVKENIYYFRKKSQREIRQNYAQYLFNIGE
jgi:hypothetical protein